MTVCLAPGTPEDGGCNATGESSQKVVGGHQSMVNHHREVMMEEAETFLVGEESLDEVSASKIPSSK